MMGAGIAALGYYLYAIGKNKQEEGNDIERDQRKKPQIIRKSSNSVIINGIEYIELQEMPSKAARKAIEVFNKITN